MARMFLEERVNISLVSRRLANKIGARKNSNPEEIGSQDIR